ncbi:MAG: hypothetical protein CMM50_08275 [Rhodospirillaceae bacterium]|nr:hypothetical protein [Rhodospirillaceae bacterium]
MADARFRALVIDSEGSGQSTLTAMLGGEGHAVLNLSDPALIVPMLRQERFDLIFLDLATTEGQGPDFVARLHDDPAVAEVPIIIVAEAQSLEAAAECLDWGADDIVARPINMTLLRARAKNALRLQTMRDSENRQLDNFRRLNEIGIALSAEKNVDRLLEMILLQAKAMTGADGGTIYLREGDRLKFAIMRTDSLHFALGGTTGREIPFPPLYLYDPATGEPNHRNVATHVGLTGNSVNIPDAYVAEGFDFSGTRAFDSKTGYRSKSFLTIPMKNYEGEVIGVLQLLNARAHDGHEVGTFALEDQQAVESLASQAAIAIDNQTLLQGQKDLLESFIKLIASAIDAKSPYTGGHCARVPVLTELLAEAACKASSGPFKDFDLNEDQQYELHIAGWLHDCGKVTTPEYVVDKATKLETIYDRIETVKTRFVVLERDAEIAYLRAVLDRPEDEPALRAAFEAQIVQLRDDRDFIIRSNTGGEFMPDANVERIKAIARLTWRDWDDAEMDFLSDDEVYNLTIRKGTLTSEERQIINHHIVMTIEMLEKLPFPKTLRRVPEFAGGHHEKMDGTGYPRGLVREEMSVPARMMAVADVFEALTAGDRPYKRAMKLSTAMDILGKMKLEHHIDPELFDLFVESGAYLKYAQQFLQPEQIDEVDVEKYLGPIEDLMPVKARA